MTPYESAQERFAGKHVLILGLGLLGGAVGDTRFFCDCGAAVRVIDQKSAVELQPSITALQGYPVEYCLGEITPGHLEWADYILKNPSIPEQHPLLVAAAKAYKPVLMRSSLFCELSRIPVIGITGTRGKTTTTMMIHQIVKNCSGKKVFLGGNIAGMSDLELLKEIDDPAHCLAVMELSSWQLQGFAAAHISPHISVVTNLYPDHLNRYPTLEAYYADKQTIVRYQTAADYAVLNTRQPEFHTWAQSMTSQPVWFDSNQLPAEISLKIPGEHNRANAAAALAVGHLLGYSESAVIEDLNQFTGVPFRLETVAKKQGVTYVNDTTATTPTAGEVALASYPNPPILICGGADKNLPLETYAKTVNTQTKAVILLAGSGTDRLKPLLIPSLILGEVTSMQAAVAMAKTHAQAGDVVLLSPGFASFGLFSNEFDRGEQFNQCVND